MNRVFLSIVIVAVLAVSVHARTAPRIENTNWTVAPSQSLQSAGVHSLIATSFHAVHAGF